MAALLFGPQLSELHVALGRLQWRAAQKPAFALAPVAVCHRGGGVHASVASHASTTYARATRVPWP